VSDEPELFTRLAALPLSVGSCALEALQRDVSSDFTRQTTVIRLRGGDEEGVGEDVTYDGPDHDVLQAAGPPAGLEGEGTLGDFCARVEAADLWPQPPAREPSRRYRIWGFESAGLDLALRQNGLSLHEAVGREPRPVTFVVSLRLGTPSTLEPVTRRLERYPGLRFKLDPAVDWDDGLVAALVATGAVDSLDLKGLYEGTIVDLPADPELYRRIAEAFPDAWIEDPRLTPETDAVLRPHRDRITWDANIHGVADIDALPFPPRMVNVKPSRIGPLRDLLTTYAECERRGIGMYGGGQFELGPGRGQIQYLASVFHPDTPNDVAPGGFNAPDPAPGLPSSPLTPAPSATGFRWGDRADA
jgi:hypothetical protein